MILETNLFGVHWTRRTTTPRLLLRLRSSLGVRFFAWFRVAPWGPFMLGQRKVRSPPLPPPMPSEQMICLLLAALLVIAHGTGGQNAHVDPSTMKNPRAGYIVDSLSVFSGLDVANKLSSFSGGRGGLNSKVQEAIARAMERKEELEREMVHIHEETEVLAQLDTDGDRKGKFKTIVTDSMDASSKTRGNEFHNQILRVQEIPIPYRQESPNATKFAAGTDNHTSSISSHPSGPDVLPRKIGTNHLQNSRFLEQHPGEHDGNVPVQYDTDPFDDNHAPHNAYGQWTPGAQVGDVQELADDEVPTHLMGNLNSMDQGAFYGRTAGTTEDGNNKKRRLYSRNEIINNQPFYPQRNELFPRVAVVRRLPTLEERPLRIAIPVITSEVQPYRWLVSKEGWLAFLPEENKLWGDGYDLVDGNLDTRIHLKMTSDTWILFDLQKSHSITGFRIYPAWANGPKDVVIQFAGRKSGPFYDAAEFQVEGTDGGSYVAVRWSGKQMQGYRNEGLQSSKFFDAGVVPVGRYFRLFIKSVWKGPYGKAMEGGTVPEQVVITEVQFFGRETVLPLNGIDKRACSYGYIYDDDTRSCMVAGT